MGAPASPTGLGSAKAPEPHSGLRPAGAIPRAVFSPDEVRAALSAIFNKAGLLEMMGKAMHRGGFPMDADRNLQSWSDWLADRIEIQIALASERGEQ